MTSGAGTCADAFATIAQAAAMEIAGSSTDPTDAIPAILQAKPDVLFLDIEMPGMNGLELQARLAEDGGRIPIIFITAYGNTRTRTRAMKAGALDFLEKPFDDEILLERVRTALGI